MRKHGKNLPKVPPHRLSCCHFPKKAWIAPGKSKHGKKNVIFRLPRGVIHSPIEMAKYEPLMFDCGRCIYCRVKKASEWTFRAVCEAKEYPANSFITLTYDAEHMPPDGGLRRSDVTKFWKRVRKAGIKCRYLQCGEYGEAGLRPHYHACVFGFDFPDRVPTGVSRKGFPQYESKQLTKLWGMGRCTVVDFCPELAAYVARYTVKKISGEKLDEVDPVTGLRPYERIVLATGEIVEVLPEFIGMSLKPGLGAKWFEKYGDEVFPKGTVVVKGKEIPAPSYFFDLLEKADPEAHAEVKAARTEFAKENPQCEREREAQKRLSKRFDSMKSRPLASIDANGGFDFLQAMRGRFVENDHA